MGHIRHHSIIVTTYNELIKEVHEKAKQIFGTCVSETVNSNINGYISFFVAPDGSKEHWEDSDNGDKNRTEFINYLDSLAYEDGSSSVSYVEVLYGDDHGYSEIVNHN